MGTPAQDTQHQHTTLQGDVVTASAPAKVILCGEHAVVYGRPAIAVPVHGIRAQATFTAGSEPGVRVHLPDIDQTWVWPPGPPDHPLVAILEHFAQQGGRPLQGTLQVRSTIPIAAGLGSSAAVAVAVVRVLARALNLSLTPAQVSAIAYKAETITHGTPSGVDNTVIAYEQPVWFVRGGPPEPFSIDRPFTLIIAHSGIQASTREVVAGVRARWQEDRSRYEAIFDAIADLVHRVRDALERGAIEAAGRLMTENHRQLQALGVSIPRLDAMVQAALAAGAWGAKLAGAGCGGNIVILTPKERVQPITVAVRRAGARDIWVTTVET